MSHPRDIPPWRAEQLYDLWIEGKRIVASSASKEDILDRAHRARRGGARHVAVYTATGELVMELDD